MFVMMKDGGGEFLSSEPADKRPLERFSLTFDPLRAAMVERGGEAYRRLVHDGFSAVAVRPVLAGVLTDAKRKGVGDRAFRASWLLARCADTQRVTLRDVVEVAP